MKELKRVTGCFKGTGATVYLCVGAIPVYTKIQNLTHATYPLFIEWYQPMIKYSGSYGGIAMINDTGVFTYLTTDGFEIYEGGDLLTSVNQTSVAYGEGVYLGWDDKDYRADSNYGTNGAAINKYTQDATTTGHFNADGVASGCRIAVGSIVRIKENASGLVKEASITALTSTPTFTTATYVTLSRAIGTGDVIFISGAYSLCPIPLGKVTPAGVKITDTAVNIDAASVVFEMDIESP